MQSPHLEAGIEPGSVDIYAPRRRFALFMGVSFAFVAGAAFLVRDERLVPLIAGRAAIAFFGLCTVYCAYRLAVRRPILTLDAKGIYDRGSALAFGRIEWSEITHVQAYAYGRQRFVGISLVDPDAVFAKLGPFKRKVVAMQQQMGMPPINIPADVLPMPADELAAILSEQVAGAAANSSHPNHGSR